ncbi:cyclopropane-fatty-acyl-phospholipid synthase family protein [Piscinibacter sakaiensis]|uniref:Cyclopropane-fatty-acyl-phospholipid synthase n=1 Tax=Piscinibacter sakaiensis TaxID=1547922 RepID=A0A0K8P011_PISS1|nr:cyclopropane-fatty-acyl-phospholipid synthase family protein [Piscinibacter sakaiensis]GAP35515.1 cyclopropane-fatty-acyl-phospholipid synthase [Piscinibacter sakaiensis]
MNPTTFSGSPLSPAALPASAPAAARAVFRLLAQVRHGSLLVQLPDGGSLQFGDPAHGPRAALRLLNWNVCGATLRSGDIGFAETYIAGDWTTPDLAGLIRLFLANREAIESMLYGHWWGALLYRVRHLLNRNSRSGSRRNIHAHYDLGNAFYALWLDPTMNYSSAWFDGDTAQALPQAQWAKVRRALREAAVQPGDRVLEIGCGWGALAECAAREFDAMVHGVTLSTEQLAWGRQRLARARLPGELRLQDYRDIDDGPYDAVVSIEMFEAVGRAYWADYFRTVHDQLKPGGRACIQSITIRDDLFERYVRSTDFIQQYIFPGGLLPSPSAFRAEAERAGLVLENTLDFGRDYAETLRRWRDAFLRQEGPVRGLGFDTRFLRTWEFYLAYCEAAFDTGSTSVMQFTLRRPG